MQYSYKKVKKIWNVITTTHEGTYGEHYERQLNYKGNK